MATARTPVAKTKPWLDQKAKNKMNAHGQCPNCIEEDEPVMVMCTICQRKFHITCVDINEEELRNLRFECPKCLKNNAEAGRTVITRKFAKQQQQQNQQPLEFTPKNTGTKPKINPSNTVVVDRPEKPKAPSKKKPKNSTKPEAPSKMKSPDSVKSFKYAKSVKSNASHKSTASQKEIIARKLQLIQEEKELLNQLETLSNKDEEESSDDDNNSSDSDSDDQNELENKNPVFNSIPVQDDVLPRRTSNRSVQLPPLSVEQENSQNRDESQSLSNQFQARLSLSKDLPVFSGCAEDWPIFINTFNRTTKLCGFTDDENVIRLGKALKGDARKMVASQLGLASCVKQIIKTLEKLYGRPEQILDSQIETLRKLPSVKMDKLETLINLSVAVDNMCAIVEASKLSAYNNNPLLMKELVDKLPNELKLDWAKFRLRVPTINVITFQEWLSEKSNEACIVTSLTSKVSDGGQRNSKGRINVHVQDENNSSLTPNADKKETNCLLCKGDCTKISECKKFLNSNVSQRWNIVRENKFCRCCLKKHFMKYPYRCRDAKNCNEDGCTSKHHRLLHSSKEDQSSEEKTQTGSNNGTFSGSHVTDVNNVQFRYLPVKLTNHDNTESINVIAFLDEGSSGTYMEKDLAKKLNLNGPIKPLHLKWTDDHSRIELNSMKIACKISGIYVKAPIHTLTDIHTVERLKLPQQNLNYDALKEKFPYLDHLPIESYENGIPQLLIGLNNWRYAIPLKIKEGDVNQPIAVKCRLGWTICANYVDDSVKNSHCHFHHKLEDQNSDEDLHELIRKFFSIESLGVQAPKYDEASRENQRAMEIMETTTKRVGEQYETGLLWKNDHFTFPDSYPMALHRLELLEERLNRKPDLCNNVKKQLNEYLEKNYIRKLSPDELKQQVERKWYLPVFPTYNPNKPEKTRLVWDARAETNGISLNKALIKGPDQLSSLYGILIRFRQKQVAIVGDIAEMFHQVKIISSDQHSQRFLWRDCDKSSKPEHYVMTVMTFGATCSPSSAQYVKNFNAFAFKNEFPRAYESIVYNHYVDDMLDSVHTVRDAFELMNQVTKIHHSGGFNIRKWKSNSKEIMMKFGESHINLTHQNVNIDMDDTFEKVLGMWWNYDNDCFTYLLKFNKGNKDVLKGLQVPTKREVLRILMSIYDPLGLIAHYLSFLKHLMQEIWSSRIDWDQQINEQHFQKWLWWIQVLPQIEKLNIPRCYLTTFDVYENVNKQLHIFVDASKNICAAVAYLRLNDEKTIECSLMGAKTKVAPLKLMSIPRLELVAAQIGARLAKQICDSLSFKVEKIFWTDSRTVLNWINTDAKSINGQFAAYRVAEIQEISEVKAWRYVPSNLNVSDEATKWKNKFVLDTNQKWFTGPEFIYHEVNNWPEQIPTKSECHKSEKVNVHVKFQPLFDIERFSSYKKLLKTVATVYRYVNILYNRIKNISVPKGPLTSTEYNKAEVAIIRQVQVQQFTMEFSKLKDNNNVHEKSVLYQLNPVMDNNSIIRSNGRCQKNLIILPRIHTLTKLIVHDMHQKLLHQNHETVVNKLRKKFHIPKLRQVLKSVVYKCQFCKNQRASSSSPMMSSLPKCRLASFQPAFTHCGVDYFGPINVTVGRRKEKRWGCLFCCMTTRAIHIEVAHKLDTDAFILCFRNFINRRGPVRHIYCDNGTNFVGAEKLLKDALKEIDNDKIAKQFINTELEWHFNPPASPHMGGCWERLVRSVKTTLYAIKPFHNFTDPVLNSYLIEVESIINSRPLTYLPLDTEESEALTPNHFIKSGEVVSPIKDINDDVKFMKKNWQNSQLLAQRFWKRWINEYLPNLNRRSKWCVPTTPLKVNDIVIIIDPSTVRNLWNRGRVIKLHTGKDGQVRSADVQTKSGTYTRPAVNLAKLDIAGGESEEN